MSSWKQLERRNEYSVGWITALAIERAAATALLDERHEQPVDFLQHESDSNSYTWGRIQHHNVVIASLASGQYGLTSATTTAQGLIASLPHIKIGLLVGIGAGVPECSLDIKLGDVAVSRPNGTSSGVIQYDSGKAKASGWERTGMLARPPNILLHALAKLESEHELYGSQITKILEAAGTSNPIFAERFKRPGQETDQIVQNSGLPSEGVQFDDIAQTGANPQIHYGNIGSGNMLVKDTATRQSIVEAIGSCVCLEMEAAGLMNSFPCLVIRGISDYADANKNDLWQRYASATSAAFAKELLLHVSKVEVEQTRRIEETLRQVQHSVKEMTINLNQKQQKALNEKRSELLRALNKKTCPYEERKDRNPNRVAGTCEWFTHHPLFFKWRDEKPGLLWVSADPGCGKSVLARFLVDELSKDTSNIVCYFFFKDDFADQKTASAAACALLRQALVQSPEGATEQILQRYADNGSRYFESFKSVWADFVEVSQLSAKKNVICILDAMDECQERDRKAFISTICEHYLSASNDIRTNVKVLATSRPYSGIVDSFSEWETKVPVVHLNGDNDDEKEAISREIDIVIESRIWDFSIRRHLSNDETEFLLQKFMTVSQRTYLWAHLTLRLLEETPGFTKGQTRQMLAVLPSTVDDAYNKILNRSVDKAKTKLILHIVLAAAEPLNLDTMSHLIALDGKHERYEELQDFIEITDRFKDTVRQLCGLFVVVVDSKLYLLHQTAREFLLSSNTTQHLQKLASTEGICYEDASMTELNWKAAFHLSDSNLIIAERCLRYLILDRNRSGPLHLALYSSRSWPMHLRYPGASYVDTVTNLALQLCDLSEQTFEAWFLIYYEFWYPLDCPIHKLDPVDHLDDKTSCARGSVNIISIIGIPELLQKYIDRNKRHIWSYNELSRALWWASLSGSPATAQLLLDLGAVPSSVVTIQYRSPDGVNFKFLDHSQTTQNLRIRRGTNISTAMSNAVRRADEAMVRLLSKEDAQVDAIYERGKTLLHIAAELGNHNILSVLLERGCSAMTLDRSGETALMTFWKCSHHKTEQRDQTCKEMRDLLWTIGMVNLRDRRDKTVLHRVVESNCLECTKFVISQGIPINAKDKHGDTPLHIAIKQYTSDPNAQIFRATIVQELLAGGANIQVKNSVGASPLHYADYFGAIELCINHGADINAQDNFGTTPLMYRLNRADQKEQLSGLVRYMLRNGAKYNIRNQKERTALWHAHHTLPKSREQQAILQDLKELGAIE